MVSFCVALSYTKGDWIGNNLGRASGPHPDLRALIDVSACCVMIARRSNAPKTSVMILAWPMNEKTGELGLECVTNPGVQRRGRFMRQKIVGPISGSTISPDLGLRVLRPKNVPMRRPVYLTVLSSSTVFLRRSRIYVI